MGWWFFKKEDANLEISKWNRMQELLNDAFSRIKTDNQLGAWVNHFDAKNKAIEERLAKLESQAYLPHYEIKKINDKVDNLHSNINKPHPEMEYMHNRLEKLENNAIKQQMMPQIRQSEVSTAAVQELNLRLAEVEQKLVNLEVKKVEQPLRSNLQEKIVKNVAKNSKDYIKNLIENLIIKYEHISGMQMKEMIVDEQTLCSKSSFYRILQEIEESGNVGFLREGKEKKYFAKAQKTHQN